MRTTALALLVAVIAAGCGSSDVETATQPPTTTTEPPASVSTRVAAPALSGTSPAGETIALGDFRGRPVMVNVWSSW